MYKIVINLTKKKLLCIIFVLDIQYIGMEYIVKGFELILIPCLATAS